MINWLEKYNKLSWGITIFGAVMIFYLSSINFDVPSLGEKGTNLISMIYHVCAFFCFSLFLFISVKKVNHIFILAIIVSIFYAVLDEIHQIFVPGRFCAFLDFALDSVGILLASVIYLSVKYRRIQNV